MKNIKLQKLIIHNFKCIKDMTIDFNGNNAIISGKNASGKSTIADCYFWLLTGKNMAGETKFAVTPLDSNGYELRGCITSVEAVLTANDKRISLKVEQVENISKKDKENIKPEDIANKTKNYYIDNSPIGTEFAYKNFISESIANEDTLKYLTNLQYFVSQKPEKQREYLTKLVDSDLSQIQGYEGIKHLIANIPAETRLKGLKQDLKALEDRLELIPKLIDENSKYLDNRFTDYAELIKSKQAYKEQIEKDLQNINDYEEIQMLATEINSNKEKYTLLWQNKDKEIQPIHQAINDVRINKHNLENELIRTEVLIKEKELEKFETVCPNCARPYENVEEALKQFTEEKKEWLEDNKPKLITLTQLIEDIENDIERLNEELLAKKNNIAKQEEVLDNEIERLKKEKDKLYQSLSSELYQKQTDLSTEIENLKTMLKAQDSINSLNQEQRNLGARKGTLRRELDLLEQFIKDKYSSLEMAINGLFKTIKFKLFEMQTNGDYKQICEPTINGVKYSDANTASKINAGLEIIDVFSERFNLRLPIFIDNSECVNKIYQPKETQLVKLFVTEKELEIKEEN